MKKFYLLLILFFFTSSLFAQNITVSKGKVNLKNYLQEIPYQKIMGIPIVQVSINGKMYNFIFDTGAPMVCIPDKIFKELNLPVLSQKKVGSASGEHKKLRFISLPELHLQNMVCLNTSGIVLHEESYWLECLGVDGIIGKNVFGNSIVHFDEQNNRIIITDNINELSLKKKNYQKMTVVRTKPLITVTMQKGENRAVSKVIFDSGQSDFCEISISRFKDYVFDIVSEGEGRQGYGAHGLAGKQKHSLLYIQEFVINGIKFNDLIVTTTYGSCSRIGAKLLEFGKTTLDYKKKRFYFEPYENINTSELAEMPWGFSRIVQNNKMMVGIIWDKKLESQINVGDEVLIINGIDLQLMNFCELFMFEVPKNETMIVELKDIHTGEIKQVEINRLKSIK